MRGFRRFVVFGSVHGVLVWSVLVQSVLVQSVLVRGLLVPVLAWSVSVCNVLIQSVQVPGKLVRGIRLGLRFNIGRTFGIRLGIWRVLGGMSLVGGWGLGCSVLTNIACFNKPNQSMLWTCV